MSGERRGWPMAALPPATVPRASVTIGVSRKATISLVSQLMVSTVMAGFDPAIHLASGRRGVNCRRPHPSQRYFAMLMQRSRGMVEEHWLRGVAFRWG